jgi:hypothetical protein
MEPSTLFQGLLAPGERLRWSGRAHNLPLAFFLFGPLAIVGVPVLGVLPAMSSAHGMPFRMSRDFPLLILIALGLLLGIVNVRMWREAAQTVYGVTDHRLLWAQGPVVRSLNLSNIAYVTVASTRSRGGVRWIEFRALGDEGTSSPSPMAWHFVETGTRDRPRRKNWSVESPETVAAWIRETMRSEQAGGETAKTHIPPRQGATK